METPRILKDKGWTEIILDDDCGYERFHSAIDLLKRECNAPFINFLDDFDTLYQDFRMGNIQLTLRYNIYEGLSLYPLKQQGSTEEEGSAAERVGKFLFHCMKAAERGKP